MKFILLILVLMLMSPLASLAQTSTPTGGSVSSTNFISLTSLPGIKDFQGATSVPALLSSLYKICIGIAATLAVLQIMRAGVLYMGGDSVTEKKEARDLIAMSIVGLILVLSPTIVFSIINPNILNLDITHDLNDLKSSTSQSPTASSGGVVQVSATSAQDCQSKGGTYTNNICTVPVGSSAATATTACTNFQGFEAHLTGSTCDLITGDNNSVRVDNQCCDNIQTGYQCCAVPKTQ